MLRFCFNLYIIKVYSIIEQLKMPSVPGTGNKQINMSSIKTQGLNSTVLSLLVHTHTSGSLLSYLAYPAIFRIMDLCDHHIEINSVSLLFTPVIAPRYTVELACGFGATVLLVVILIVIYHVYWLEMVLFYRAHFGTDETILGE